MFSKHDKPFKESHISYIQTKIGQTSLRLNRKFLLGIYSIDEKKILIFLI